MKYKQNLHTHSTYCDGADSPEEILDAALKMGFDSIGFSGHSYMSYSPNYSMSLEGTEEYRHCINSLKTKFAGSLDVFCGLEVDMLSNVDMTGYDYLIGSVHYLELKGEKVGMDRSKEIVEGIVKDYFGGDGIKYAESYFEHVSRLPRYGNFDIVGHFDLVAKHFETSSAVDTTSRKYLSAAFEAIKSLKGKIPLFEVNTGGISRGYRSIPYPSVPLIKEFGRQGLGVVITSDSHAKENLDCHFCEAEKLLTECGFKEYYVLTEQGFKAVSF